MRGGRVHEGCIRGFRGVAGVSQGCFRGASGVYNLDGGGVLLVRAPDEQVPRRPRVPLDPVPARKVHAGQGQLSLDVAAQSVERSALYYNFMTSGGQERDASTCMRRHQDSALAFVIEKALNA